MARWLVVIVVVQACAVDPSGLPPSGEADGGAWDLGSFDGGSDPAGDLGPPPDLPGCVPRPETCNGTNDDCDGAVDEELSGQPCDDDGDGCMDGRTTCSGSELLCEGDDGTMTGDTCDGPDADDELEGTWACDADTLTCQGDCVAASETCNQRDDDCDGAVDEDGACSDEGDDCRSVLRGDAVYLFCVDGDSWRSARDECARGEYDLVRIDDEAERVFLAGESGTGDWWVGARTDRITGFGRRDKNAWYWRPSDVEVSHDLWAPDEPSGDGQCGHTGSRFDGRLNDSDCGDEFNYICEGRIRP